MDIGLEKNGFLHADDMVFPGVEVARRGRAGRTKGKRITELLKPGQEILVQAIKDPLKTKGPRLSMQLSIAGPLPRVRAAGRGHRRVAPARRQGARPAAPRRPARPTWATGGAIIRTAAQGAKREDFEREIKYLHKLHDVLQKRAEETAAPGDGLPGGRPVGAGRARHLLGRVREGDRGRPQAAPPARVVLQPHRAGAARAARALQGRRAAVRALRRRGGDPVGAAGAGWTCPAAAT